MKKLTFDFVKDSFEHEGYLFLSDNYINSKQKLDYICPEGHKGSMSWSNWNQGQRCIHCCGKFKLNINYIRSEFEKEGYILLSVVYINAHQKLNYICPEGHKHSITWANWSQNRRCPYCNIGKVGSNIRLTYKSVNNEFEKEGYNLLSKEYVDNQQKLSYVCPRGHIGSISWNSWQSGNRCYYCGFISTANKKRTHIDLVRTMFKNEGYTLLTEKYKNSHQRLNYVCPKGHNGFISLSNWKQGHRCGKCSNRVSKWEKDVKKFIASLNISFKSNDRKQLIKPDTKRPMELDIWISDLNKAIECNGVYWHSAVKRIKCDAIKRDLCKQQGIDLLVITDKEWNENKSVVENKIKEFLLAV